MLGKISLLCALYLAQGMPFGVQSVALPIMLRQQGASLEQIGLAGALALPWLLKALWAPLVDRSGSRWRWILAMQACLALTSVLAAWACVGNAMDIKVLAWAILALNFAAATQDIAVDGLAVDLLKKGTSDNDDFGAKMLGWGNSAQVIGYKCGMLIGGGVLVWVSASLGWTAVFVLMAAIYAAVFMATALAQRRFSELAAVTRARPIGVVLSALLEQLRVRGVASALAVIVFYKAGETIVVTMWKPFLIDQGFSAAQIGAWVGVYGMAASIGGSLAGGWAVQRFGTARALWWAAALRTVALVVEVAVAAGSPTAGGVIGATCLEHIFSGALTTAMFAWMMARVDVRVGASHYTLLASCEVLGKMPAGWLSGYLAGSAGYIAAFAVGTLISALYTLALPWLLRRTAAPPEHALANAELVKE